MYEKLSIKLKYSSEKDNIVESFYLPVLKASNRYDRAVGFFSSKVLNEYVRSLSDFYFNDGIMRLIISPELSNEDIATLKRTTDYEITDTIKEIAERTLEKLFETETPESTNLFFNLILSGSLEVKIAMLKGNQGIFHEKYGIFYEHEGNDVIAINGSNNETYYGVEVNQESFNTFCSWKPGQNDYIEEHKKDFENYWDNNSNKLNVIKVTKENFEDIFNKIEKIDVDKIYKKIRKEQEQIIESELMGLDFIPYDYQKAAAEKLVNGRNGILKFATGSGKTKTAIYYMHLLKKQSSKNFFVVVVPDLTLSNQWIDELAQYDKNIVKVSSENSDWKLELSRSISIYNRNQVANEIIVTTTQTMFRGGSNSSFLKQIRNLDEFTIIVDECHNLSTENIIENLPMNATRRVGLSATPTSLQPSYLENQMLDYFNGIISEYNLSDAIRDGRLCKYNYYPIVIELEEDEKAKYDEYTKNIATKLQQLENDPDDKEARRLLDLLYFSRSRIIYGARQKLDSLVELLNESVDLEYLLIYCGAADITSPDDVESDSLSQLNAVNSILKNNGIAHTQYTSKENRKDRQAALELFKRETFTVLTAIKCLDEGVDIPSVRNAVIMASSTNEREFVQRRGRVLRKAPGKTIVNIYDMVVRDFENFSSNLNTNESKRMFAFARDAENYDEVFSNNKVYMEQILEMEGNLNGE